MTTPYQSSLGLITIKTGPRGSMLVKPMRAELVRQQIAKLKPIKPVKLTSVKVGLKRAYPVFAPGMSTADYIRKYAQLNDSVKLAKLAHDCPNVYEPAPMLDPTIPECIEEFDCDPVYVAPQLITHNYTEIRV